MRRLYRRFRSSNDPGGTGGGARWRHHQGPPLFLGLLLVAFGIVFLLDAFDLVQAHEVLRTMWPTAILVWGVWRLFFCRTGDRFIGLLAVATGGVLLGNELLGWDVHIWQLIWPTLLIGFGLRILLRGRRRDLPPPPSAPPGGSVPPDAEPQADAGATVTGDASSYIDEFAIMGHAARTSASQAFHGGHLNAVMGALEIDLSQCRMSGDEIRVDVLLVMGSIEFRIPREWTVDSRVALVMASLEDGSEPPVAGPSKRFVLEGTAFMGSIEVSN
jgi:hypothetical protein